MPSTMPDDPTSVRSRLSALRTKWLATLPGKLEGIRGSFHSLLADEWDSVTAVDARQQVHGLSGAGATFGLQEVSRRARALEDELASVHRTGAPPDREANARIVARLAELLDAPGSADPMPESLTRAEDASPRRPCGSQVWVVEDETALGEALARQMTHFGYDVRVFLDGESVVAALAAGDRPDVAVVDVVLPEGPMHGVELAERLRDRPEGPVPTIAITVRRDLECRLAAVRAGIGAYLSKPVRIGALVDELERLATSTPAEPYRVLVVEDDPSQASHTVEVLEGAGFVTRHRPGTAGILDVLVEFRPELVLMDLDLVDCTGIELAEVIRQHEPFVGVPIVYLSAERDVKRQLRAMQRGGDAFLAKPFDPEHLVGWARAWLRRSRALASRLALDGLTGVLNHSSLETRLEAEVARARRQRSPLSVVMVDIDLFKGVNDRFGHATGDGVLRVMAQLLRGRLRKSDSVARYGGEEFVLLLPDTDPERAREVVDELRVRFSDVAFQHPSGEFRVTFSAGVAGYPRHSTTTALREAADQALYRAKDSGRDQVRLAT